MNRVDDINLARAKASVARQGPSDLTALAIAGRFEGIVELQKNDEEFVALLRVLKYAGISSRPSPSASGNFYVYHWDGFPNLPAAAPLLRKFGALGWRKDRKPRLPSGDDNSIAFYLRKGDLNLTISSQLVLGTGPDSCKKVQVGTKETPVYEIECPEGALEAEA